MARKRPITAFGWAIKRKLAELELDQRQFCEKYGIPENRLGEIMTGYRIAGKHRKQIEQILNIEQIPDEMEVANEIFSNDTHKRCEAVHS